MLATTINTVKLIFIFNLFNVTHMVHLPHYYISIQTRNVLKKMVANNVGHCPGFRLGWNRSTRFCSRADLSRTAIS